MTEIVTYAKAEFFRKPNFSESRIFPKAEFVRKPNVQNSEVPKIQRVDWTHDMIIVIIVKRHLLIWHKLDTSAKCALWQIRHRLNPHERVNDYQRYSMLIVLPLRSTSCTLGNSSSLYAAGDDQFCRYFFALSAKKDIYIKKFFSVCDDDKCYGENTS